MFDKILKQKRGSAFYLIYTGAFLFVGTILYIVYSQIIVEHLQPLAVSQFMDADDVAESNKFIGYWGWTMPILIFVSLVFLWTRTGQVSQYGR